MVLRKTRHLLPSGGLQQNFLDGCLPLSKPGCLAHVNKGIHTGQATRLPLSGPKDTIMRYENSAREKKAIGQISYSTN